MLDFTRLRVIDAVARHGSVTAAAKELHYSQPSVSHHLARLEAETGAQLLQRVGRGIRLTQRVDVAVIFRYDETEPEPDNVRLHHLLDDPDYLLSTRRGRKLAALRDATWIAGCERCRSHLLSLCADEGFEPRIGYTSDDMVVMQALVAAGLGVATLPGLALRAHRATGIVAGRLPGSERHVYAATYGEPPDPPATAALLTALTEAAELS
jgi:DNA-binding transcriptional LysR family regulator